MHFTRLTLLGIILSVPSILLADSLNVALSSLVTVQYASNDPILIPINNADPMKMVDNNSSTFFNLPPGQEGTTFLFDLVSEFQITTFAARPFATVSFRLRGYKLEGSVDGVQWTTMAEDTNQLLLTATASVVPTPARYVRLTVTRMDPNRPYPAVTVLAEVQLWAQITRPLVYGLSLSSSSSAGPGFHDLRWSSMLLDSTALLRLSYRAVGSTDSETIVREDIPNTRKFVWETSGLEDKSYDITLAPSSANPGDGGGIRATLASFGNTALFISDTTLYSLGHVYRPWGHSAVLNDSISLFWRFWSKVSRPYTFEISVSTDSLRSWQPITTITDSLARSVRIPAPVAAKTSPWTFYRVGLMSNGKEWTNIRSEIPVILSSKPTGLFPRWHVPGPRASFPSGSMLTYRAESGTTKILAGQNWLVDSQGRTILGCSDVFASSFDQAVSDIDNDGIVELIDYGYVQQISMIHEDSTEFQKRPTYSFALSSVQTVDIDNDGKKELLVGERGAIEMFGDTLQFLDRLTFADTNHVATHVGIGNLAGDAQPEIAYTMNNQLIVAHRNGSMAPGFPVQFAESLLGWTMLVDFDKTQSPDILFASLSKLYCYRADGTPRAGFPISFADRLDEPDGRDGKAPAFADINSDGYLEIILKSWSPWGSPRNEDPMTRIHAIRRTGEYVAGWPVNIKEYFPFYHNNTHDTTASWKSKVIYSQGMFSASLVASMDGDAVPEILLKSDNGMLYVLNANGTMKEGYPVYICGGIETPVLADIDNDGSLNLVVYTLRDAPGDNRWDGSVFNYKLHCFDFGPGSYNAACIPWPMYLQNPERTGIAPQPMTSVRDEKIELPTEFALEQNYPNPFNPTTVIRYQVTGISGQSSRVGKVDLRVFDLIGREVAVLVNKEQEPGRYAVRFDASKLQSGTYFCRLTAGEYRVVKKMVVVK